MSPAADGGAGNPPKKKKPPKIVPGFSFAPKGGGGHTVRHSQPSMPQSFSNPTPVYRPSSTYTPSSYSAPSYYSAPSAPRRPLPKPAEPPSVIYDQFMSGFGTLGGNRQKPKQDFLSDILRGFKDIDPFAGFGDNKPDKPEQNDLASLLLDPMRKNPTREFTMDRGEPGASDEFLKRLRNMEKQPLGTEIQMPERLRHVGENKNAALKWFWDKDAIQSVLSDYAAAGDDFNYSYYMSQVMDARYKQKESFVFDRTKRRSDRIQEVLGEAADALYDDNENNDQYLQQYMEDHPNFELEPLKFRNDFGITGTMLRREMDQRLEGVTDKDKRAEIRGQYLSYSGAIPTYNKIEETYQMHNEIVNNRIDDFMKRYKDMVGEDFEPFTDEAAETNDLAQELMDASADDSLKMFYLGKRGANRERRKEREQIERELGIRAPSIKQMVMMQVNAGILDPNDEEAVDKAIINFRNPAHPDTRGMYASVAMAQDPNFTESYALEFINRYYDKYVTKLAKNTKDAEIDARIAEVEDYHDVQGFGDLVSDVWNTDIKGSFGAFEKAPEGMGFEEDRKARLEWYKENAGGWRDYIFKGEANSFGKGLGWTLDKLLRFNYASAGFADEFFQNNKRNNRNIHNSNPKELALDIASNFGAGFEEGYNQFFRGSDLATKEVEPTTYSDVLEHQGVENPWVKHGVGLALDVALDPTTYVGVGLIGHGAVLGMRGAGGLSRAAIEGANHASSRMIAMRYGKEFADGLDLARVQRKSISKANWVSRVTNPNLSKQAQTAWRVRRIIAGDHLPADAPVAQTVDDLPPLGPEASLAEIDSHLQELALRENALNNDIGVEALRDHMRNFTKTMGEYTPTPGQADILVEKALGNAPRGLFHRIAMQSKEFALSKGFSKTSYKSDPTGEAAQRAASEIDELSTRFPEGGAAFDARKAELEKTVSKGTGEPIADLERMFMDESVEFSRGAELRSVFAKAAGVGADDLPFTDRELLEAVSRGPGMMRKVDPEFRQMYDDAYKLLTKSQNVLQRLKDRGVGTSNDRWRRATIAYNTAQHQLDRGTAASSLEYLRQLENQGPLIGVEGGLARHAKNPIYSDPTKAGKLTTLRDAIVKHRMRSGDELGAKGVEVERTKALPRTDSDKLFPRGEHRPMGEKPAAEATERAAAPNLGGKQKGDWQYTDSIAPGIDKLADNAPRGEYDYADEIIDRDFADETLDSILREFPRDDGLDIAQRAIERQLKHMRLDSKGRLKGLPGPEARRMLTEAPGQFLTGGKLDTNKILDAVEVRKVQEGTPYERYEVMYDREVYKGLSDEGKAFLRNFTTTLRDRYNARYLDLNLQAKSEVTGIGVTDRAQHVYDPKVKGPRHAVILGASGKKSLHEAAVKRMGADAKSIRSDMERETWGELTGFQKANQKIHQAIQQSNKDGVPPVVYIFTDKSMDNEANKWLRQSLDYATSRGVTTYTIQTRKGQKPLTTIHNGSTVAEKSAVDDSKVLKSTGQYANSAWGKMFPEGFSSPHEFMRAAMESGDAEDFYNVLMAPGAPVNATDRMFLQTDDVIRDRLTDDAISADDLARTSGGEGFQGLHFRMERMPYNLRKARVKMTETVMRHLDDYPEVMEEAVKIQRRSRGRINATRSKQIAAGSEVVEPHIKEWAQVVKNYIDSLPPKAQVKVFNDIFNGSLRAAAKDAERQASLQTAKDRRMARAAVDRSPAQGDILTPATYNKLRDDSLREATDDLVKEVNTRGSLPGTASGTRLRINLPRTDEQLMESAGKMFGPVLANGERRTVNESAKDVIRELKAEHAVKRADAELDLLRATNDAERQAIKDTIEGLERTKVRQLAEVEIARKQALEAKKILRRNDIADAIIQATFWPGKRLNGDQARQLIEAKKINLESPANKLATPEVAAEAAAHRYYRVVANSWSDRLRSIGHLDTYRRPSEQLTTPEGREILALMTGMTPVIVKANIKRIDDRMGGMMLENRKAAFQAYLTGNRYGGGQPEYTQGIADEMNELESIWNGTHKDYQFALEGRPGSYSFVTWEDLAHWLPEEYLPDLKTLGKLKRSNGGSVKMADVWRALGTSKPRQGYDPAVFAWVMRVAAGQARDYRVSVNAINKTFGVPRVLVYKGTDDSRGLSTGISGIKPTRESQEVERLAQLGWRTNSALGNSHYFHPEVADEIDTLMRLINEKDSRTQFGKAMDSAISGWKGLHTTYSPPYYTRNLVGEVMMAWLGGVSNPKYYGRAVRGLKWLRGTDQDLADLITKLPELKGRLPVETVKGSERAFTLKGGATGDYKTAWALYIEHGLKSTFTNTDLRAHGARASTGALFSDRKAIRKAKQQFNKLHDFGESAEDYARFAHFLHALEHSGKGNIEAAARYAAQRVRRYHFDYSDVSTFEKVVVGRLWPFFKWTRFAAPVLLAHMALKPGKVVAPNKIMGNLTDAINEELSSGTLNSDDMYEGTDGHLPKYTGIAPSWVRDLFAYQVGGMPDSEDSYATYLRFATPQTDALTQAWQPTDTAITLLNPALKAAIELSRNKSMDPDMGDLSLYGSDFHKAYGINDAEAFGLYAGRQLGPFAKTAAQLYQDNQENRDGESYGDYREEQGFDGWKRLMSNFSGAGVYQVHKDQLVADEVHPPVEPPEQVGGSLLDALVAKQKSGGAKAPEQEGLPQNANIADTGNGFQQFPDFKFTPFDFSGFQNFFNGFGGFNSFGGFGGGGFSSGSGSSGSVSIDRSEWGDQLLQLIQALKDSIDQGDVTSA